MLASSYSYSAIDTITSTTPLTVNQTLVSNGDAFELGFFSTIQSPTTGSSKDGFGSGNHAVMITAFTVDEDPYEKVEAFLLNNRVSMPSKRHYYREMKMDELRLPSLFDFTTLSMATNNFSDANKPGYGVFFELIVRMCAFAVCNYLKSVGGIKLGRAYQLAKKHEDYNIAFEAIKAKGIAYGDITLIRDWGVWSMIMIFEVEEKVTDCRNKEIAGTFEARGRDTDDSSTLDAPAISLFRQSVTFFSTSNIIDPIPQSRIRVNIPIDIFLNVNGFIMTLQQNNNRDTSEMWRVAYEAVESVTYTLLNE
ncbi:hypothetical protein Tco_1313848 [Tanacetum coccineum]